LYEMKGVQNYIPFRKYQLKNVNKVYTVSKYGSEYLKALYPKYISKITYSRLGVTTNARNPIFDKKPYTIVSVSNVIPVKRVYLILEITKHLEKEYNWIHFGDGNLFNELQKMVSDFKADNVTVKLMGRIPNVEVMNFFQNN